MKVKVEESVSLEKKSKVNYKLHLHGLGPPCLYRWRGSLSRILVSMAIPTNKTLNVKPM